MSEQIPYGSWPSPITAAALVQGAVSINEVVPDGEDIWWSEGRPSEGGRIALMRWRAGKVKEMTPPDANVRTLVHEYGGGAWWVENQIAYGVDYQTQQVMAYAKGKSPVALTKPTRRDTQARYADFRVSPDGRWLLAVREKHRRRNEPVNSIVAIATDGTQRIEQLWQGSDFVSSPRLSPDGTRMAWLAWDHPNMPWDRTNLWVAEFDDGALSGPMALVGNGDEALVQPEWAADGSLYVCSDRHEWSNLYRVDGDALRPVVTGEFEIGALAWVFGQSQYAFTPSGPVVVQGHPTGDRLAIGPRRLPATGDTSITSLHATDDGDVIYIGATYDREPEIVKIHLGRPTPRREVIRGGRDLGLDPAFFATPQLVKFPTGDNERAYGLFYHPAHPDMSGDPGELPPLVVMAHGGPTAMARRQLQLNIRYFTSRGFGVLDVDYRGSGGYGRTYRNALAGRWGIADVEDCARGAAYLAERGLVDVDRLAIRGGSAGGYTVLCALCFHDAFAVGASHYGVADLEALATDTHKFESRYLDGLVGPYPEQAQLYRDRSPIHHVDGFSAPMIVLQGSEDRIVPPNQSEMIVDALERRGIAVQYVLFEGEQHGFRKAENIVTALESELAFFGEILGFSPVI